MPRLRSQFEAPNPNRNFPELGRDEMDHGHAIYSIARSVSALGLNDWLPTVMHWLGHYDGLETMLEDPCDPAICVRQVLLRHVAQQPAGGSAPRLASEAQALKQAIAEELATLDFVCYRVFLGQRGRHRAYWEPLEQSFLSFRDGRQGDEGLGGWFTEDLQQIVQQVTGFLLAPARPADPPERVTAPP